MGVFSMIVLIVLITTIGKVMSDRSSRVEPPLNAPKLGPGEADSILQSLDDLNGRVVRLEEERDFYKALLDAPARQQGLPSPGTGSSDPEATGSG